MASRSEGRSIASLGRLSCWHGTACAQSSTSACRCASTTEHRPASTARRLSAGHTPTDPCVLVVEFRLRLMRGWGHAAFRRESLLNTPLFAGFPGFVSKLWLAHDEHGTYRGVYEWDGPERAEHYARCLWCVLALGSVPGSIHYNVLPGVRRDEFLQAPGLLGVRAPDTGWWRLREAA